MIELDALNWGPNWLNRSLAEPHDFIRRIDEATAGDVWVADGNYRLALPNILRGATDLIWLDFNRSVVMARVHPPFTDPRHSAGRALARYGEPRAVPQMVGQGASDPLGLGHLRRQAGAV